MPITSSAKKALRASVTKRAFNDARRDAIRSALKRLKKAATGGDKKAVAEALSLSYKAIDKAMKRGILKKNTAARRKAVFAKIAKAAK